jgi:hypothetical protein
MFPDPPQAAEDEPTMTDLRGVLPAQRPPVDATVLDEPTSEVPVITPRTDREPDATSGAEAGPEPDLTEDAPTTDEPAPDLAPAADLDTSSDHGTAPAAAPVGDDPEPDPDQPTEPPPVALTDSTAPAGTEPADPQPQPQVFTAPEVPDMVEPAFPSSSSEMAKMTWRPAGDPLARMMSGPPVSAPPMPPAAGPDLDEPAGWSERPDYPAPADLPADPPAGPDGTGRPGDVAERPIALWSDSAANDLRERWRELQGQFFDDPDAAVAGARNLVTEAVRSLADTLLAAQDELDPYREGGRVDTETMRVAMRRYREFLERVLAL